MDLKGKRIILGSNSPRRRELLSGLNIDFEVDTGNNFDEHFSSDTPFDEVPRLMSIGKSHGFHRPLAKNEILITADTMVILPPTEGQPGEILGKPKDRADAVRMLHDLSGREHHVTTAVTLRTIDREETFSVTTEVWFKALTDEEIDYYVDTFKPYDKAGAYAIQEWIGFAGITRIEGSYFNVVGFPVQRVYEALLKLL
ncbi:MAG: septum formation protein Maf [Bacteroidales bacterium]|nr:septum formation protein Maf [Bacteroidales bacterium]MBR2747064.1 septum formation protein Maf [Bacteroidales bacterium]